MSHPSGGPLDGVTVVALEQAVAAPFATRQLADPVLSVALVALAVRTTRRRT